MESSLPSLVLSQRSFVATSASPPLACNSRFAAAFGEAHLRQVLKAYAANYNRVLTHLSLGKDAPLGLWRAA